MEIIPSPSPYWEGSGNDAADALWIYRRVKRLDESRDNAIPDTDSVRAYFKALKTAQAEKSIPELDVAKKIVYGRFLSVTGGIKFNVSKADAYAMVTKYLCGIESSEYDLSKGFCFYSEKWGNGKSTLAKCMRQIDEVMPYLFYGGYDSYIDATDFAAKYAKFGYDYFEKVARSYVLLIDDLGNEKMTQKFLADGNPLAQLIKYRHERMLRTHVTTNMPLGKLADIYGYYIADRMVAMFNFFEMDGGSMRS